MKTTVDAYDGTVTYWADLEEPIIRAWARAFPDLFTDIDDAPPDLAAHFRYPENLFQVQATQFANYHVEDATRFYNKQDFWQIPDDPTQERGWRRPYRPSLFRTSAPTTCCSRCPETRPSGSSW